MCGNGFNEVPGIANRIISRRATLGGGVASALTIALGPVCMAHAADKAIGSLHGQGFCNLNLFLAAAADITQQDGFKLDLITTPTLADTTTMIAAGHVDVGVIAYTVFAALWDRGVPLKVIGGGGVGGLGLISKEPIRDPADVKGKSLATFQMDTVEVICYDWCKANNVDYADLNVRYFDTVNSSVQAFYSGDIDLLSTIEPWVTNTVQEVSGSALVTDGEDIYNTKYYTDCVLVASEAAIAERPEALTALVKSMARAQLMAETNPMEVLGQLVGPYYQTDMENAVIAMEKQPSVVDARNQQQFIIDRVQSLRELGYLNNTLTPEAFDWTLLERAIDEEQDTFAALKTYTD